MRWVQQAAMPPHRCAVIPFKGNSSATRGFLDTGMDLPGWDPHVYLSGEACELVAQAIKWQPASVASRERAKVQQLEARVAELEAQVAEHERFRDAAEYTLGQFGAKVHKKPGRKPAGVA